MYLLTEHLLEMFGFRKGLPSTGCSKMYLLMYGLNEEQISCSHANSFQ